VLTKSFLFLSLSTPTPLFFFSLFPHPTLLCCPPADPHRDYAAGISLTIGLTLIFAPHLYFEDKPYGIPINPLLGDAVQSTANTALLSMLGSMFVVHFFLFYINRWNALTGKALGIALTFAVINEVRIGMLMNNGMNGWFFFAVLHTLTTLHMSFNANAMWTSSTLKADEVRRAAKKAAKTK